MSFFSLLAQLAGQGGYRTVFLVKKLVIAFLLLLLTLLVTGGFVQNKDGKGVSDADTALLTQYTVRKKAYKLYRLQYKSTYPYPERSSRKVNKPMIPRQMPTETAALRKLTAKSAIVMDARSGETLYAYCAELPGQPASTIKILTGLISMRSLKRGEMVYASRRAARMPRSKIYLRRGKSYRADDLINAVLLASANDASVALAEKISGSERAFARLMTGKALEMGAKFTICKTATGLTKRGQKSTVRDLAVIFNMAMKNWGFARKMARKRVKTSDGKILKNHNKALWDVEGAEGGKTGYTRAAGQTYVGKFRRGKDALVVAVMGSKNRWQDVLNLVEYGFSRQQKRVITAHKKDTSPAGSVYADTLSVFAQK